MEELKACPFCGSTNVEISPYGGAKAVACMDCFCRSEIFEGENAKEKAIAAWNRRAAPENKALTLEELRKMDGEPVWVKEIDGTGCGEWTIIDIGAQTEMLKALSPDTGYKEYNYGKTWLAYARKPEGSAP